ncbi:MAG: hypothetical protein WC570_04790 [Patescibacteria group bacterium]
MIDLIVVLAFILFVAVLIMDVKDDVVEILKKRPGYIYPILLTLVLFIILAWFISDKVVMDDNVELIDNLSYVFFLIMALRAMIYFLHRRIAGKSK